MIKIRKNIVRRNYFYCNAFGIESPKTKEISGMEVRNLYEAGRLKDIATYCSHDIYATYQLYKIWDDILKMYSIKV